eukprot:scaffold301752_cov142-Cyclotella_meneghiniana.AAC.1
MSVTEIASRSYIQFNDMSAKLSTTARASGSMDLADIGSISIENATISIAFGLGLVEISEKTFFDRISSVLAAMKESEWQKVG